MERIYYVQIVILVYVLLREVVVMSFQIFDFTIKIGIVSVFIIVETQVLLVVLVATEKTVQQEQKLKLKIDEVDKESV